jgi:hypothetical protein
MENNIKSQIINSYLSQQMNADNPSYQMQTIDVPGPNELDEFKTHVRLWMEMDNSVKKMQASIRERNAAKSVISAKILQFMCKFNIEDLNTKEGKLKYRVSQVKEPLSQSILKTRFVQNYDPKKTAEEMTSKIFDERKMIEKHSLRRTK